ncbi:MATE family efflux transporter, partial [Gemmiger formicilis]|nr:MATE family efflux transporter [Gemmiger formicilis]
TEDPVIRQYGVDYLSVCCLFSLGCMIQCMVEKLLTATAVLEKPMRMRFMQKVITLPTEVMAMEGMPT